MQIVYECSNGKRIAGVIRRCDGRDKKSRTFTVFFGRGEDGGWI
jgi:hypothetical protein